MDSQQLAGYLSNVWGNLDARPNLQAFLFMLDENYGAFLDAVHKSNLDNGELLLRGVSAVLTSTQQFVRDQPIRLIFNDIHELESVMDLYARKINVSESDDPIAGLNQSIRQHRKTDFFQLLVHVHNIMVNIQLLRSAYDIIQSNLAPRPVQNESDSNISIRLFHSIEHADILIKMRSLGEIYEILARTINISITDHPLEISKLESGTFWAVLKEPGPLMELVAWVVKSTARFVYESYTQTGRVAWGVRTVNEFANLRERLEKWDRTQA